jgi:hypothetical protein
MHHDATHGGVARAIEPAQLASAGTTNPPAPDQWAGISQRTARKPPTIATPSAIVMASR